jgi:hypothetical protein
MSDNTEQVSYGQPGYQTLEDEIAAHQEAREYFRRRILACIRGRLRERKFLRWRLGLLLLGCLLLTGLLISIPTPIQPSWQVAIAVLAAWPIYLLFLYLWARSETRRLNLAGHWDMLVARDERGEFQDRHTSEQIDKVVRQAWDGSRCQSSAQGNNLLGMFILACVTLGTWIVWDLLRTGPALVAEIILDGVIVPTYPEYSDRLPSEPWYKAAFLNTAPHFASAALIAILLATLSTVYPHTH